MVIETHMTFCVTEQDFPEDEPKMGQKQSFLNLFKSLIISFYWIFSIMKIYLICCVLAQIPYLGKMLSLRYGPECSQAIRLQNFSIGHISRTIP